MKTQAIVFEAPMSLSTRSIELRSPQESDVVVQSRFSGISTGTERLLWSGKMPQFPGMGYPLVPGYETVGTVVEAGSRSGRAVGETVFVPGAHAFKDVRSLFGASAANLVVAGDKAVPVENDYVEENVLLALAATAHHALYRASTLPDLIIGHGVLGRLLARSVVALGGKPPVVWECNAARSEETAYRVVDAAADDKQDYRCVIDASGDASIIHQLLPSLARDAEIVLAGFYHSELSFPFAPAFQREIRIHVAAEWQRDDLRAVQSLVATGALSLDALITHHQPAENAEQAYGLAFEDPACLKMVIDWSHS